MHTPNLATLLANNSKRISPLRLAIKVYAIFLGILVIVPVKPAFPTNIIAIFFLGITTLFSLAGMKVGSLKINNNIRERNYNIDFDLLSKSIVMISTIGVSLAVIDRFLIRGVGFSQNALEARAAIESAGSGVLGIFAAFLSSFAAFGVISVWLARKSSNKKYRTISLVAYTNLLIYLYLSIMLSSRSLLLVVFVNHILARLLITTRMNKKRLIFFFGFTFLVTLVVLTALVILFQNRLSLMGLSAIDSLQLSSYAYTLAPTKSALNIINSNEFLRSFGAAAFSLVLYVYHGIFEFFYLFNNLGPHHTYGSETFWLPVKIFETAFGPIDRLNLESVKNYRIGVFTTFAGPLFLDFSITTPIVAFVIFFFLSIPSRLVTQGKSQWVFFSITTGTIIIFSPIVSLLQSATGMYLIVAAACIGLFIPKRYINTQ